MNSFYRILFYKLLGIKLLRFPEYYSRCHTFFSHFFISLHFYCTRFAQLLSMHYCHHLLFDCSYRELFNFSNSFRPLRFTGFTGVEFSFIIFHSFIKRVNILAKTHAYWFLWLLLDAGRDSGPPITGGALPESLELVPVAGLDRRRRSASARSSSLAASSVPRANNSAWPGCVSPWSPLRRGPWRWQEAAGDGRPYAGTCRLAALVFESAPCIRASCVDRDWM